MQQYFSSPADWLERLEGNYLYSLWHTHNPSAKKRDYSIVFEPAGMGEKAAQAKISSLAVINFWLGENLMI